MAPCAIDGGPLKVASRQLNKEKMGVEMNKDHRDLFLIGVPFVAGGIVFLLVAFATGLVTTTSASRTNIAMARIDERATMCFDAATAFLSTEGSGTSTPTNAALAEQFFATSGDKRTDTLVRERCQKMLDT
jgi:hypothetical protein